jgi:nucleoside-diphosphate-sugar epimerase
MRVAITGASGFLGGHLVAAMREAGHEPVAVVRTPARAVRLGVEIVQADLADRDALIRAVRGCDALVANAALAPGHARPTAAAYQEANLLGAEHHLEAARRTGARVVWISTVAVYRTRLFRCLGEEAEKLSPTARFDWNHLTTDPRYASSKAAAERLAWAASDRGEVALTVLRPGPIYGPGDGKLTARYLAKLERRVVFAPTVAVPHVHARDVADAAAAALGRPATVGRAYNTTGDPVSPYRVLRTWARVLARPCRVLPVPVPLRLDFDDAAAVRELGFRSRSIAAGAEGLRDQRV